MAQEQQPDRGLFGLWGGKKHDKQQQAQEHQHGGAAGSPHTQVIPSGEGHLHSSVYGYGGENSHVSDTHSYGTGIGVGHTATSAGYNATGVPHDGSYTDAYNTSAGVGGHASHSPPGTGTGYDPTGVPHAASTGTAAAHRATHGDGDGGVEEKKHGMLEKLHKSGHSSSSSGSSEDERGKSTEKRRGRMAGVKDKIKNILPGHKNKENLRGTGMGYDSSWIM